MMVTFRSSAAPDIVMLRDLAEYLLGLVGKGLDVRGVISTKPRSRNFAASEGKSGMGNLISVSFRDDIS